MSPEVQKWLLKHHFLLIRRGETIRMLADPYEEKTARWFEPPLQPCGLQEMDWRDKGSLAR